MARSLHLIPPFGWRYVAVMALLLATTSPGLTQSTRSSDPAVDQLLLKASGGPDQLGRSLSALTRMREYASVDTLVKTIPGQQLSAADQSRVAAQISSNERLRIAATGEVSPESQAILDQLFNAHRQVLQDPARLNQAIAALNSPNPDEQLGAARVLFQGGEASTAALIASVSATDVSNPNIGAQRDNWLRLLLRLDRTSGIAGLQRVALYGNDKVRAGAIAALTRVGVEPYALELATAIHAQPAEPIAAEIASAAIARTGTALPSRNATLESLRKRLQEASDIAVNNPRMPGRTDVWIMNPDGTGVVLDQSPDWVIRYRDAADAAARLIRLGDTEPASVSRQLIAQMAYRVANDPDWGNPEETLSFWKSNIEDAGLGSMGVELLQHAILVATETDNDPAMVGLLRLIGVGEATDQPNVYPVGSASDWLVGPGSRVTPMVDAVDHPDPQVRYEAAEAIVRLAPAMPYAGSSRVKNRLQQMANLSARPIAIVVENRPEVISEWEQVMHQAGYEPRFVSTVRQMEYCASVGEDVRLIAIKREPKDASAIEAIDVARRILVVRDVPLLVYTDPAPYVELVIESEEGPELSARARQALDDDASSVPDEFGVYGGIESLDGIVEHDLLIGDLYMDHTLRPSLDLAFIGESRWGEHSPRSGLIRAGTRPRSAAGMYDLMLESRQLRHLPPLSSLDRRWYRDAAMVALENQR